MAQRQETVDNVLDDGGVFLGATCCLCKHRERSLAREGKTEFIRSLKIAGWKWKSGEWTCWRCLELK